MEPDSCRDEHDNVVCPGKPPLWFEGVAKRSKHLAQTSVTTFFLWNLTVVGTNMIMWFAQSEAQLVEFYQIVPARNGDKQQKQTKPKTKKRQYRTNITYTGISRQVQRWRVRPAVLCNLPMRRASYFKSAPLGQGGHQSVLSGPVLPGGWQVS